jgi:hypothetical protein
VRLLLPHLQLHSLLLKMLLLLRRFRAACAALLPRLPPHPNRPCHRLTHHQLQGRDHLLLLLAAASRKRSTQQNIEAAIQLPLAEGKYLTAVH